jgi:hypothetical protein
MYVKISTCKKFEFDLYRNKVTKTHIFCMCICALNKKIDWMYC